MTNQATRQTSYTVLRANQVIDIAGKIWVGINYARLRDISFFSGHTRRIKGVDFAPVQESIHSRESFLVPGPRMVN